MLLDAKTRALREAFHPAIETERLTLRRPVIADARAIAVHANDRRIAENTRRLPFPYRLQDAEQFLVMAAEGRAGTVFAIERKDSEVIGVCGLEWNDPRAPEFGIWLGVPHWGQGYGTEAAMAVIGLAFDAAPIACVRAGVRVTNAASLRMLEKCGFTWTAVELRRFRALGSSAPVDRLVLDRDAWRAAKESSRVRRVA
jgi:RimJ/RimL family protein N-acetyltransferase